MTFTKDTKAKKIFIYGSGTLVALFLILAGLYNFGINVETSGNQVCGSTCVSYFNISLSNYSLCFGSTFKGIYLEGNATYELYKADLRYGIDNPNRWKSYNFTTNTCLNKNTKYQFKLVGHKQPTQTIKWGLSLQGKDLDPLWLSMPIINITSPLNTTYYTYDLNLSWTISETPDWLGYSLNGAENISFPVFYNGPCYQETVNAPITGDGNCSLDYSGAYTFDNIIKWNDPTNVYDGDWNTFGNCSVVGSTTGVNMRYAIPPNATYSSIWQVKDSGGIYNFTIPASCWNWSINYPNTFDLRVLTGVYGGKNRSIWMCHNWTTYPILRMGLEGSQNVFEEAMIWDINNYYSTDITAQDGSNEVVVCANDSANNLSCSNVVFNVATPDIDYNVILPLGFIRFLNCSPDFENPISIPEGQSSLDNSINATNNGTGAADLQIRINQTTANGWTLFASNQSDLSQNVALDTSWQTIYSSVSDQIYRQIWLFANCSFISSNPRTNIEMRVNY